MKPTSNDFSTYERCLETTASASGSRNKWHAIELFVAQMEDNPGQLKELMYAKAKQVADQFDRARSVDTSSGQMSLNFDTYFVLGENERVPAHAATAEHVNAWWQIQETDFRRQAAAYEAKREWRDAVVPLMRQHNTSAYEATLLLTEGAQHVAEAHRRLTPEQAGDDR